MADLERLTQEIEAPFINPAWLYYSLLLPKGGTFVSIGSGETPFHDFSTITAAAIAGSEGRGMIADPQGEFGHPYGPSKHHLNVRGLGGANEYIRHAQILQNAGVELAPLTWLGETSGLERFTGVADESVNATFDHNTVSYVVGEPSMKNSILRKLGVRAVLRESYRVLVPGGVHIMQTDAYRFGFTSSGRASGDNPLIHVESEMRQAGFRQCLHVLVDDTYTLPLSGNAYDFLHQASKGEGAVADVCYRLLMNIQNLDGQLSIEISSADTQYYWKHMCPDMYIGVK